MYSDMESSDGLEQRDKGPAGRVAQEAHELGCVHGAADIRIREGAKELARTHGSSRLGIFCPTTNCEHSGIPYPPIHGDWVEYIPLCILHALPD